jgi:hypothetical protein
MLIFANFYPVIVKNTVIFMLTTVRTSNLTIRSLVIKRYKIRINNTIQKPENLEG